MPRHPLPPFARPYLAALLRLAIVMALWTVCRVAFFLYNRDLFAEVGVGALFAMCLAGLRFDLSGVLYVNAPYIVGALLPVRQRHHPIYQRVLTGVFLALNVVGLAANVIDFIYYRATLGRLTASVFEEFANDDLTGHMTRFAASEWEVTVFGLACFGALAWATTRVRLPTTAPTTRALVYYPTGLALMLAGLTMTVVGMRGGFFQRAHRPITPSTAGAYVDEPHHTAIVLNTPFTVIRTLGKQGLARLDHFADEAELEAVFSPRHEPRSAMLASRPNVVIFILESWGREHVGGLNGVPREESVSPFFDGLAADGLSFTNAFANGRKSIDAMPSILASVPSLVNSYVLSPYSRNRLESLAHILGRRGYATAFLHGAPNGSMGFDAFARLAGFDRYLGKNEYGPVAPHDDDGVWGIWDEPFFDFSARAMASLEQPFFATVFSLSSHHPYAVPEAYVGKLRTGPVRLQETIHYTDQALEKFFIQARTMPWFDNTLFVLTADHAASPHAPEYRTTLGRFRIPLVFYAPALGLRGVDDLPAQQLDIMPTVLGLLGHDAPYWAFGRDLRAADADRYAIQWRGGTFQFVEGDDLLFFDGSNARALHDYRQDPLLQRNLLPTAEERGAARTRRARAVVQQYVNRMLDDRLTESPRR